MSKQDKLIQKLRQNPKNIRFEEIDNILSWYDFERRQASKGTSHYVYTLVTAHKSYRLTIPFKRPFIKKFYIQDALEILDELDIEIDSDEPESGDES